MGPGRGRSGEGGGYFGPGHNVSYQSGVISEPYRL